MLREATPEPFQSPERPFALIFPLFHAPPLFSTVWILFWLQGSCRRQDSCQGIKPFFYQKGKYFLNATNHFPRKVLQSNTNPEGHFLTTLSLFLLMLKVNPTEQWNKYSL